MRFLISIFSILLVSCSTTPVNTYFSPSLETSKAVIYHFRDSAFVAGGMNFHIASKDRLITTLKNASYYREVVDPGKYVFYKRDQISDGWVYVSGGAYLIHNALQGFDEIISFEVESDKVYFLQWRRTGAELVEENDALTKIPFLEEIK